VPPIKLKYLVIAAVAERALVKSIVATLSIKRISDQEIVNEVFNQTNKTLSKSRLHNVRQSIPSMAQHTPTRSQYLLLQLCYNVQMRKNV
ncbi:MAG: hypothetical protein WCE25_11270, partial [Nitrososphaeraceae archaeon]